MKIKNIRVSTVNHTGLHKGNRTLREMAQGSRDAESAAMVGLDEHIRLITGLNTYIDCPDGPYRYARAEFER